MSKTATEPSTPTPRNDSALRRRLGVQALVLAAMCLLTSISWAQAPTAEQRELLPFPFSAEQIRDAWQPGLVYMIENKTPKGVARQRWTVQSADADGVDIEYADVAEDGTAMGEPRVQRALWTELRDHASFPAAFSTLQEVRQTTALGELDGYLYTVVNEAAKMTTEFFFAASMPGAPMYMVIHQDGVEALAMRVTEVRRP